MKGENKRIYIVLTQLVGLLPRSLSEFARHSSIDVDDETDTTTANDSESVFGGSACSSPRSLSGVLDEESNVGVRKQSIAGVSEQTRTIKKVSSVEWRAAKPTKRARRPTAVRVRDLENLSVSIPPPSAGSSTSLNERTPLLKAGVRTDTRRTVEDVGSKTSEVAFGRMVEVGLPLVVAHEISRSIFRFRKMGNLETIGPAGFNSMNGLVQAMTDQLGSMERM
jgi:putative membrane protein